MARRRLTARQADDHIKELRRGRIPARSTREDLDAPLDAGIEVTGEAPRYRVALAVDGVEVSSCVVVDMQQQIGSEIVHMGGIADVSTHGDHRFQGYSSRVLENALRWMRANGFDSSMLYGIPAYYPRFGYAKAFADCKFSVAVREAEVVEPGGHRFVRYRKEHLRAVLRMYHANNATRTGPTRRCPKTWRPWRKGLNFGTKAETWVALDAKGKPEGYVVYHEEPATARILEVGFARPGVFASIVRHAARRAVRERMENIDLYLPEDDLFVDYCKALGVDEHTRRPRCGGCMVRLIRIPTALAKAAPVLGSRMAGSGQLTIRTNLGDVGLAWSGGELTVGAPHRRGLTARMPQWALAQLLYGYRRAATLAVAGAASASPRAMDALEEMFPVRPHYHFAVDHF